MADASKMPNNLVYFQWGRPDNENPRLSSAISATATTIVVTNAAQDEDGSAITGNFIMGIKDNNGYVENIWIPNAASTDGLTFTGVTRGIDLAGLDYTTQNTAGNAVAHEAGDPVKCIVSGVNFQLMLSALQGDIASGGENWQIGNAANNNITIYAANGDANKPFWRYVAASNQWVYSNDGVSSTPFGTGAGVTGGDGISVTAGDIDIDLTDTVIFKSTSAGAGDSGKVARLNASGQFDTSFTGATYTEINQLSGTTNIAEANTFFGATDMTGAEAQTLSSQGAAETLHFHTQTVVQVTRALSAATGTQNVAHGLSTTPKYVQIIARGIQTFAGAHPENVVLMSDGWSDGTVDMCSYGGATGWDAGTGDPRLGVGNSATKCVYIQSSEGAGVTRRQDADVSAINGTNVVLNWTLTDAGAPAQDGTINLTLIVYA